jgi:hypothetical protein
MDERLVELSDELARSGNLFLQLSTDPGGMSYLRVVPSADIERISSQPNDVEQELRYHTRPDLDGISLSYPAYDPLDDSPEMPPVMLHYAVNRPVGAQWGESDLAPVLRWLSRYASWLEDRVRLNRFRNAFMYVVKARFASESARATRQSQLTTNPPASGSVLTDGKREWSVLPRTGSADASRMGWQSRNDCRGRGAAAALSANRNPARAQPRKLPRPTLRPLSKGSAPCARSWDVLRAAH